MLKNVFKVIEFFAWHLDYVLGSCCLLGVLTHIIAWDQLCTGEMVKYKSDFYCMWLGLALTIIVMYVIAQLHLASCATKV